MTVKIIIKLVQICSLIVFTMCLKVKTSLIFAEIFSEQISLSLIIPKLSRRAALTIVNTLFAICAEGKSSINKFFSLYLCYKSGLSLQASYWVMVDIVKIGIALVSKIRFNW